MSEKRIRVLFVDDEENNLKAFRTSFRRDMDVLLASSGEEALELLETGMFHVIVSDQRMPGMSGSEFLAIARVRHPQIMRMLLTGYADLEAVVDAVNKGGIHAYATKPWDASDLQLRIRQIFEVQQLREQKEKLLQQYSRIFEDSGDPIVLLDNRGGLIEANPAAKRLLDMESGLVTEHSLHEFLEEPDRSLQRIRSHRKGNAYTNIDVRLRTPTGNVIDCLVSMAYLGKRDDGRVMYQAIMKDITDRRLEEQRLQELNVELDNRVASRTSQLLEALEDLGSFSYTVAHDLRSPLKNIVALSDLLKAHTRSTVDVEACAYAERIHKNGLRLIGLVDDLLRFSQTNTRELELRDIALAPLVHAVIEEQVPEERRSQLRVEIPDGALIHTDAPMLKVVLHNLLSNALKFTRNREHPKITVRWERSGTMDHIRVIDNGVGFESSQTDQAFGVFKRLHHPDQFEGTGVGLAIVKRIVNKHGGKVWAESSPDKGTIMHVDLPIGDQGTTTLPVFHQVA